MERDFKSITDFALQLNGLLSVLARMQFFTENVFSQVQ